jgi:hypothetical protein
MELVLIAVAVMLFAALIRLVVRYEPQPLRPQPLLVREEREQSC